MLQYIVLATAWNILGGYTGYVNFGTAAFFALGAYTLGRAAQALSAADPAADRWSAASVSGLVGLGMGYLTLRLRGVFFAIATLALAVVAADPDHQLGLCRRLARRLHHPAAAQRRSFGNYIQYFFLIMLVLAVIAVAIARTIERSRLGLGFAAIRDDELAAEAAGVPTLRLKLIATTL